MATSRSSSKNIEKFNKKPASVIELVFTHTVPKLGMLNIAKKLSESSISFYFKIFKKEKIYSSWASQNPIDLFRLDRNFKG